MPSAALNGQSLWYEDTGGNGPAVVFSHVRVVGTKYIRADCVLAFPNESSISTSAIVV